MELCFHDKKDSIRYRPPRLTINKNSRKIRKPSLPLPVVQFRRPVIIHTYSPKVIQTDPGRFMWLVQSLTGSADTRSRCKKNKPTAADQQVADDHKTEYCNPTSALFTGEGDQEFQRQQPSTDTSSTSCGVRSYHEQDSGIHDGSSSDSDEVFLQDGVFAKACESDSVETSPRRVLPRFTDRVSSYNRPPCPSFDSSFQASRSEPFASTEPRIPTYNPSSDLEPIPSHLQSFFLSPNLSNSFDIENFLNDSALISSSSAWNPDGCLISPFKGSSCFMQNLFSPAMLLNSPILDAQTLEKLLSPAAKDAFLHREFDEGRATDTFLTRPVAS